MNALRRRAALLRLREALRSSGADLIFLQEIGVAAGGEIPERQYEVLADGVWPAHAYGRNAVITGGHHGNAILSKYPITSWRNHDCTVGRAERRGILHCVIDLPGTADGLHALCVHLALFESHRRTQVDRLLELMRNAIRRDAPVVIGGDFNDWRERSHRRLIDDGSLMEIHSGTDARPRRTFPSRRPLLRLDRIYVRNLGYRALTVSSRPWSRVSDHIPLAAEIWPAP